MSRQIGNQEQDEEAEDGDAEDEDDNDDNDDVKFYGLDFLLNYNVHGNTNDENKNGDNNDDDDDDDDDDGDDVNDGSGFVRNLGEYDLDGDNGVQVEGVMEEINRLVLNQLVDSNKANELKVKYNSLYENYLFRKRSEKHILERAKKYFQLIQLQKHPTSNGHDKDGGGVDDDNDGDDDDDDDDDDEGFKALRDNFLKCSRDLLLCEMKNDERDLLLENLKVEKNSLMNQLRVISDTKIEDNVDDGKTANIINQEEVNHLKIEVLEMNSEVDDLRALSQAKQEEILHLKQEMICLEQSFYEECSKSKKIDEKVLTVLNRKNEAEKQLFKQIKELETNQLNLLNENENLIKNLNENYEQSNDLRQEIFNNEIIIEKLKKLEKEQTREKNTAKMLMDNSRQLKLNLKNTLEEKSLEYGKLVKLKKEYVSVLKELKRAQTKLETTENSYKFIAESHNKLQNLKTASIDLECQRFENLKESIKSDILKAKEELKNQHQLSQSEIEMAEFLMKRQEKILQDISKMRIEIHEYNKIANIKRDEKNRRAREKLKAEEQLREAKEEVAMKDNVINDHKSKLNKMESQLKEISQTYNIVKGERNTLASLLLSGSQKIDELRSKINTKQNELMVLKSSSTGKEELTQKQHLACLTSMLTTDKTQIELANCQKTLIGLEHDRQEKVYSVKLLKKNLNKVKEEMKEVSEKQNVELNLKQKKSCVLLRKNELHAKLNKKLRSIEDEMVNVTLKHSTQNEKYDLLLLKVKDLKRFIAVLQQNLKERQHIRDKIAVLQIQISESADTLIELEARHINSNDKERLRFLDGRILSQDEMYERITKLEERLWKLDRDVKDKKIMIHELTKSTTSMQSQMDQNKENTLNIITQVSWLNMKIRKKTRKLMALVAELSMKKSETIAMKQVIERMKQEIEKSLDNFNKGLPPNQDIEKLLLRGMKNKVRPNESVSDVGLSRYDSDRHLFPVTKSLSLKNQEIKDD